MKKYLALALLVALLAGCNESPAPQPDSPTAPPDGAGQPLSAGFTLILRFTGVIGFVPENGEATIKFARAPKHAAVVLIRKDFVDLDASRDPRYSKGSDPYYDPFHRFDIPNNAKLAIGGSDGNSLNIGMPIQDPYCPNEQNANNIAWFLDMSRVNGDGKIYTEARDPRGLTVAEMRVTEGDVFARDLSRFDQVDGPVVKWSIPRSDGGTFEQAMAEVVEIHQTMESSTAEITFSDKKGPITINSNGAPKVVVEIKNSEEDSLCTKPKYISSDDTDSYVNLHFAALGALLHSPVMNLTPTAYESCPDSVPPDPQYPDLLCRHPSLLGSPQCPGGTYKPPGG